MKYNTITRARVLLAAGTMLAGVTANAALTHAIFNASNGSGLSARATFDVSGGTTLTVLIENTSAGDVLVPSQVLTALFWDPNANLTRVSAVLGSGSTVLFPPSGGSGPVVGGEWAYVSGLLGAPGGAALGISSSGLGLFGPGDRFPGANLQGPTSPDGLQYGLTSAGDNPLTGNAAVTGANALIRNSALFTFSIGAGGYDLANVHNLTFQYGTALTDPQITVVPEPTTIIAGAMLLLPFALSTVRRFRKA